MNTLRDPEKAAETLRPEEKQPLIVFLAARLRADSPQMSPRGPSASRSRVVGIRFRGGATLSFFALPDHRECVHAHAPETDGEHCPRREGFLMLVR
jgi:hypothetical protein